MLKKINKLIHISKDENKDIHKKLVSIAQKIKRKGFDGEKHLLIDIKLMESLVSPDKVEVKDNLGRVELEL